MRRVASEPLAGSADAPSAPAESLTERAVTYGEARDYQFRYAAAGEATPFAEVWFADSPGLPIRDSRTCKAYVERATNRLLLVNDAGSDLLAGTIGQREVLANGQCAIDLTSVRVTADPSRLTVAMAVKFRTDYTPAAVYTQWVDAMGTSSGWAEAKSPVDTVCVNLCEGVVAASH
jgi:hypothetical protein